jgi:hypothetical protein
MVACNTPTGLAMSKPVTMTRYRIVRGGACFQAQVKKFWLWWNIGDRRASIERAIAEIKFHQQRSCFSPTQAQIDAAKPEELI